MMLSSAILVQSMPNLLVSFFFKPLPRNTCFFTILVGATAVTLVAFTAGAGFAAGAGLAAGFAAGFGASLAALAAGFDFAAAGSTFFSYRTRFLLKKNLG
jgi:hypothetical protein